MIPLFEGEASGFTFIDGRDVFRFHRFSESYEKCGLQIKKMPMLIERGPL